MDTFVMPFHHSLYKAPPVSVHRFSHVCQGLRQGGHGGLRCYKSSSKPNDMEAERVRRNRGRCKNTGQGGEIIQHTITCVCRSEFSPQREDLNEAGKGVSKIQYLCVFCKQ